MLMGANLYSKNAEYALFTTESALIKRKKQNVKKKPVVSVISSYKPAFSLGFFYSPIRLIKNTVYKTVRMMPPALGPAAELKARQDIIRS